MSQKKYKVKVIQILLKNNKLANSGEVVSESQLNGNAEELVKGGYIKPVDGKKSAKDDKKAEKEAFDKAFEAGELDADQLDEITIKEIKTYADKHNLKYDDQAVKADLIKDVLKGEKSE
ncbi:hypothetical protein [Christiangramia sp.]|uniref:hypothetical protein n=1 Tax=Christiangramia sp. TaxID=1931228 RepID=UPI00262ABD11|nr:hypothetical protein [Christiangramia sp.]